MYRYLILVLAIFVGCSNAEVDKARREMAEAQYKPVSDWVETLVYKQKIKPKTGFYREQEFELIKIVRSYKLSRAQYRDVKLLTFSSFPTDLKLTDLEAYELFTGKEL